MPALHERQAARLRVLMEADADSDRAWRIHRNTVWRAAIDALNDAYPILRRIVGADFFEALARDFIAEHPPREASLILFGAELADFITNYPPLGKLAYAPDVARLERAWLESYHAADAAPLVAAEIAGIDPEHLIEAPFAIHPACRLVASPHPIDAIWTLHQQDDILVPAALPARGAHMIVCRPDHEIIVQAVEPSCFAFIRALMAGKPLGEALTAAGSASMSAALAHLQRAIALRLFTAISLPGRAEK